MAGVNKEQIEAARAVDLLTYLQTHEPGSIKKDGAEYCLREHDSLKISNGKWYWFSRGFGSNNALDFLVQVRGLNFTEAVRTIAGDGDSPAYSYTPPKPLPEKPKKPFKLPEPNFNNFRAIAYLMNRGINRLVIDLCIEAGTLYESKQRANCVFVGKDGDKPKFACVRGTFGSFKMDIESSDKRFSFLFPAKPESDSNIVNVFESPIDALSFASMERENSHTRPPSQHTECARGFTWRNEHYLSLGGVSSRALNQFLETHPDVSDIRLRLDNDDRGIAAMERIRLELSENPKYRLMSEASPIGKDWNDLLQYVRLQDKAEKPERRPNKEAAL